MAKVTVRGGRKTYELTDAEKRSLQIQMNQSYSEEDRQRIRYTAEDLDRSIVNSVNSNQYQDTQALSDTQRRLNAYQRSLRQLEALGYDMTGGMEHLRAMRTAANTQNRVHSSFGSQEEYDTARQYAADLEGLNLEAAWAELDALKQERDSYAQGASGNWASERFASLFSGNNRGQNVSLDEFANMSLDDMRGYIDDVKASQGIGDAKLRDYDRRITERQQYLTQIQGARDLADLEAVARNSDFTSNSVAVSDVQQPLHRQTEAQVYHDYINSTPEQRVNILREMTGGHSGNAAIDHYETIDRMNEDEIAVFNYYYNTQGEEAAMKYLDALTPIIRQRRASERFAELKGRTGAELAFGAAAGLDRVGSGLRGLVSSEEQTPSWRQYTSGMVREDLQDNRIFKNSNAKNSAGQVAYDAITSTANMLPSILASSLVGLINPVAGQVTGAALMGASASGNAYQEMLNLGYDKGQARAYSVLVGGSEAALSYLLSGITKLGGVLPQGATKALIQNTDKAISRVAIQFLGSSISEFSEEYLQEVISAVLQNEILRAGNDLSKVTEDAIYSGLLGALTGGVLEGGGAITGAVQTRNTGKQFLESGAKLGDLQALAAMMPDVESVQNLSRRVNEDSNAYTVGRFYEEVTGAMSEQNKADLSAVRQDVLAELEKAGITGKDANTIANAVEAKITGRELSTSQQRLIARVGESVPRIGDIIDRGVNSDRVGDGIARSLLHSNITRDMAGQQTASDAPTTAEEKTLPVTQTAQQNASQTNSADTSTTIAEAAKNTGVTEAALSRIYKMGSENQSEEEFSAAAEEVVNFAEESSLPAEKVLAYVNTLSSVSVLTPAQRSALVDIGRDSIRLAYNIGYAGQNINDALENKRLSRYSKAEITAAYNRGADAAKAKTGSMPQATSEAKTRKKGTVRFDGDAQAFLRKFNKAQRSAYRIMSRLAEITGMNIVLYDSVADSQGRYAEVQGSFDPADPNTVRVDINAGLSGEADIGKLAEYTMLRTFTHEFVHSLEINAPKQYAELKRVVFEQMRQNGKDVTELIEQKVVEYGTDENGNDILSYDDASHEVLAESLTEVLPQSTFIEALATKHRNIFDKIYESLKRFMALIKARFAEMNQGTMKAEAKALMQEMNGVMQYTQNIVEAFDKAALAAVETVQSRNAETSENVEATRTEDVSQEKADNAETSPFNKKLLNLLRSAKKNYRRVGVFSYEGRQYVTDGALIMPTTEEGVRYAREELNASVLSAESATHVFSNLDTLITEPPVEGKRENIGIYRFTVGTQNIYVNKKLFSFIDGGLLYTTGENQLGAIKSVDENGNILGALLPMRIKSDPGEMVPASVKSFSKKMVSAIQKKTNENPTGKVRYQHRENVDRTSPTEYAPVFYSKMAKVIEGMKQEKFGASSVVNMFRGKGVTNEEIKWSGIEAWLEGKKSVTKSEILEFIAGSALQIDEEVLTDEQTPYSEEQQRTLDSYNAQRENAVNNLAEAWRNRFGEQLPTRHEYYDFVRNRIEKSNEENAKASEEYKRYKDAERALRKVVDDNDYFGFDSLSEAMAVIRSDDGTFADYYEMSAEESDAFTSYFADREAYWNVPAVVSNEERRSLYRLAERVDEIGRDIESFKREHEKESERRKTKWGEYKIPGGTNYREVLFKIPNSTYWNDSTLMHWENRLGVFAHARVQDLNTAEGTMLFIEEIQSDWHNEGRKKGYETDRTSVAMIEERETLYKRQEDIRKELRTANKEYDVFLDDYWGSDMSDEEYQRTAERIMEKQQRLTNSLDAVNQQIAELTRKIKEFVPDAPFRENYQEYVLKRLIREAAEKNYDSIGWTTADIQSRRWDSKYAEGYRIEYDQDIPKFLNKYGKKWGTMVERTALDNGTEIWTMPISESMKEAVLYEGQTRFQRRENLTDREVLERAAADVAQFGNLTEGEAYALEVFNKHLAKLKDLQAQRREQGRIFHDNTFEKGGDRNAAVEARNRMGVLDGQIQREVNSLLDLENKAVLQKVLQKARGIVEADIRERNRENLERYRDRQDNSAAIRKYRSRIMTDVETLNGWLMKPDNKSVVKHIPEALRGSVVPFLQSIDFTSKRQLSGGAATKADAEFVKRLNTLRDVMKEYAPDANTYEGYADLPPDFMENLDKLVQASYELTSSGGETFIINRMTSAELHELSYLVRKVKKFVQDFNLFHNNAMFKHVYDAGDNSISTLSEMKDAGSEANKVNDFLQWKQILPAYAWERFGDGGESIFRELMKAQDQLGFNSKRIIEFSEKAFTRKEIDEWRKQIVPIKLKSGKTMSIPATYLMGLYELSKREAGRRHILGNGIKVGKWKEGKNDGGKSFEIAQEDLDTMFKNLSTRQKQVADALQTFMQSVCADWGNYVTMARFGEKQFGDPHYYPIVSDSNNRDAKSDEAPQATGLYRLLNMGFTKQLNEKANDKIMLFDIFDVFSNHAADMAQYNAFALPVVDALKWFNYKQRDANGKMIDSVREEMDRVYGVPVLKDGKSGRGYAQAFVTGILQAINGTETQGSRNDAPAMKGLGLYNRAQVAYNFRVVIQQPTAIVRSALVLDPASVLRALTVKNIKKNMQEMQEYSGIAVWKDLGFYDVNISRNLTGMILQDKNFGDKFVDAGMAGAEAADKLTWSWIWAACKEEVIAKQNLKPGDDGFFAAVSAKFDEVIYKTQVVDSVLTKNAYMRDAGVVAKTLSSFMSESARNSSMLLDAAERIRRGLRSGMSKQEVWRKHGKHLSRAMIVYGIGAVLNAAAQSLPDMARDDDEYETWLEKYWVAFKSNVGENLNPLNLLPVISDVFEALKGLYAELAKANGKKTNLYAYQPPTVIGQFYDSLVNGIGEFFKKVFGNDTNYTWPGAIGKLLKGLSGTVGLPVYNIWRTAVNTWNLIAPKRIEIDSYDPGEKAEIKYAYLDGYLTEEEASELLMQIVDKDGESMSADDAYWLIREWDGGEDYSRFGGLYEAVLGGKDLEDAMEDLLAHGYTEKELLSKAKGEIGRAFRDGDITRDKAEELLLHYGFAETQDDAYWVIRNWSAEEGTTNYSALYSAMRGEGDFDNAFEELTSHGYTEEEVLGQIKSKITEWAVEDVITLTEAENMYVRYGRLSPEDSAERRTILEWQDNGYDIDMSQAYVIRNYEEFCEPAGISVETYMGYRESVSAITGEGKKNGRMAAIDALPLTDEQKDALYFMEGWAESTIDEAPWH